MSIPRPPPPVTTVLCRSAVPHLTNHQATRQELRRRHHRGQTDATLSVRGATAGWSGLRNPARDRFPAGGPIRLRDRQGRTDTSGTRGALGRLEGWGEITGRLGWDRARRCLTWNAAAAGPSGRVAARVFHLTTRGNTVRPSDQKRTRLAFLTAFPDKKGNRVMAKGFPVRMERQPRCSPRDPRWRRFRRRRRFETALGPAIGTRPRRQRRGGRPPGRDATDHGDGVIPASDS